MDLSGALQWAQNNRMLCVCVFVFWFILLFAKAVLQRRKRQIEFARTQRNTARPPATASVAASKKPKSN